MSDIVERLRKELAQKEALLNEWKIEESKLKVDKQTFEKLQQKAKGYAMEKGDSKRYLKIVQEYQSIQDNLIKLQEKISDKEANVTALKIKIDKETAFDSLLRATPIDKHTGSYSFNVKDYDPVSESDLVGQGELKIDFFQIDFKPTNQKFWIPKNISFDGSYNKSFSVVMDTALNDFVGDAKTKLEAEISVILKIGGIPQSTTTSFSIGAEAGAEITAKVPEGEGKAGAKVAVNFGHSWSTDFKGGSISLKFDFKYDCLGSKPKLIKNVIKIPSYKTINALVTSPSGEWFEGELDLMITDEKNNL